MWTENSIARSISCSKLKCSSVISTLQGVIGNQSASVLSFWVRPDQLLCHHFLDGFVLPWERGFCPYPPPSKSPLCQWFSKAGLETSNISITWELARKAASPVSPHPRPPEWDTLGWGQSSVFEGSFQVFLMLIQVLSTAALGHGSPRQGGHSGVRSEDFCWRHTNWPERKLGLMPEVFIWLWFWTVLLADRKWYGWACWSSRNTRGHTLVAAFTHVDTRTSTLRHSTIVCRSDKPAPLGCMLTWNTFSYPYLPSVSLLWRDVYLNLWSIF